MKYCKDCKYIRGRIYCCSPINGLSPVTGRPEIEYASILRQRKVCGPEAIGFEPKWWRTLLPVK